MPLATRPEAPSTFENAQDLAYSELAELDLQRAAQTRRTASATSISPVCSGSAARRSARRSYGFRRKG